MDFNLEYQDKRQCIFARFTHLQTSALVKKTCMQAKSPDSAMTKWSRQFVTDNLLRVKSPQQMNLFFIACCDENS